MWQDWWTKVSFLQHCMLFLCLQLQVTKLARCSFNSENLRFSKPMLNLSCSFFIQPFHRLQFACKVSWINLTQRFRDFIFLCTRLSVHLLLSLNLPISFLPHIPHLLHVNPQQHTLLQFGVCQYLSQELCSIMQVLPVDPGSQVVHHSLLDLLLDPLVCLSLQLQRLVVILPLEGQKLKKYNKEKRMKDKRKCLFCINRFMLVWDLCVNKLFC